MRKLSILFILVLASGLIAAGCGDDDDDNGGDTTATTQESSGDTTSVPTTGNDEVDAAANQAVEACKDTINASPQLSDDAKGKLNELCEKAASGEVADQQEASREVCETIVEDTIPAGPARDRALATCG